MGPRSKATALELTGSGNRRKGSPLVGYGSHRMHAGAIAASALAALLVGCLAIRPTAQPGNRFERTQLSDVFYAEGAAIGDINGDGTADIVAGPYWYEGPDYMNRHAFYKPEAFDPLEYSDNFVVEVHDVNADGRSDILVVGFPGQEAYWYENVEENQGYWRRHLIAAGVGNESPLFTDLDGDARPELVFNHGGSVGYAEYDPNRPREPWVFHAVSEARDYGPFTHGLGVGDVSGDGHVDVLMADGWWENPGATPTTPRLSDSWRFHAADFGPGGAQMFTDDVDGDGLNDVITSLEAHGWGLSWFRQIRNGSEIHFEENLIMGEKAEDNPHGVRFSQPHALGLVDIDQDGLQDIVTGKRFWAHGPEGDPEPNAPAVLYWFRLIRSEAGRARFVPELIDDDSGVGVSIAVEDLTGNGRPDLVITNKKGTFLFRQ